MRKIEYIVVHHSATTDSGTVSWGAIEAYHKSQGWQDIGYNAGIELIEGAVYAMIGRDVTINAAAVKEARMNERGLHVCVVGDYDLAPPPLQVLQTLATRIIKPWMHEYNIDAAHIIGHRDAGLMAGFDWQKGQYKSCPGKMFNLDHLRGLLA